MALMNVPSCVVTDARRIGRQVCADHISPGTFQALSPAIWDFRDGIVAATPEHDHIFAASDRIGYVRPRHWLGNWLRRAAHEIVHGKIDLHRRERIFHRRNRPQVNDDCREIIVGKCLEGVIRHHRKQRRAVIPDAFADRTCNLIIRPLADAGFRVGRDVRNIHFPGKLREHPSPLVQ